MYAYWTSDSPEPVSDAVTFMVETEFFDQYFPPASTEYVNGAVLSHAVDGSAVSMRTVTVFVVVLFALSFTVSVYTYSPSVAAWKYDHADDDAVGDVVNSTFVAVPPSFETASTALSKFASEHVPLRANAPVLMYVVPDVKSLPSPAVPTVLSL